MTELVHKAEGLSLEELEAHTGELLPAREQMQLIGDVGVNLAVPVSTAVAANVLSPDSNAVAISQQNVNQQNIFDSFNGGAAGDGGLGGAGGANNVNQANDADVLIAEDSFNTTDGGGAL